MMRVSINIIPNSGQSESCCKAMAAGIERHGDKAVLRKDTDYNMAGFDAACFWGFWEPCQRIVKECRDHSKPWVFFDLAYWARDTHYKVTVNGRHPTDYFMSRADCPDGRFLKYNFKIKPWKNDGKHILLAGMSGKAAWSFGMNAEEYERTQIEAIRAHTDRPIIYRPKPSWTGSKPIPGAAYDKDTPISQLLQNAWAVVTHHSNVGCDALLEGIPVFTKYGAASIMALRDVSNIEQPCYPEGREQFFANLAYCQWTLAEMRSGETWHFLKESKLL